MRVYDNWSTLVLLMLLSFSVVGVAVAILLKHSYSFHYVISRITVVIAEFIVILGLSGSGFRGRGILDGKP